MNCQQETTTSDQAFCQGQMIKIFLRINSTKKGTDFVCPSSITGSQLTQILTNLISSNKFLKQTCNQGSINDLQFILEGHKIDPFGQSLINLRQNSIIHVLNKQDTNQQTITVTFRYQSPELAQDNLCQAEVLTSDKIEQIAQKIIPLNFSKFLNQITLVYLGSELSIQTTFRQASIENFSEIIVIDRLRKENQQNEDPFQNAQQISLSTFGFKPRTIEVTEKEPIHVMGLNMPYNPKIQANRVKKLLEQNVTENQLFMQQHQHIMGSSQNQQAITITMSQNQSMQNEPPLLMSSQQIGQKIDQEKNIPTKQEIEEEKSLKIIEQEK